jgi:hypothetical protein
MWCKNEDLATFPNVCDIGDKRLISIVVGPSFTVCHMHGAVVLAFSNSDMGKDKTKLHLERF